RAPESRGQHGLGSLTCHRSATALSIRAELKATRIETPYASLVFLAAATMTPLTGRALASSSPKSMPFTTRDFRLENGAVLPEVTLAYETYGTLAPNGRNAVLATHGYTSSHHLAGRYGASGVAKGHKSGDVGNWDKLIGPGKALDTDKLF